MAKTKSNEATEATEQQTMATIDEGGTSLATEGAYDIEFTGLEEVSASDVRVATLVWNAKAEDAEGNEVPKTVFFDTVDETVSKTKDLIFLLLHKTRSFAEYDSSSGDTIVHCRSNDLVTGTMANGTVRRCEGCPDARFVKGEKRKCAEIANLLAIDESAGGKLVQLRCKKTSMPPWKNALNKFWLNKRRVITKQIVTAPDGTKKTVERASLANYPLFAHRMRLSLVLEKKGANPYAIPVFEKIGDVPIEEQRQFAETARAIREYFVERSHDTVAVDERAGGDESGDTSFDTSSFVDATPRG